MVYLTMFYLTLCSCVHVFVCSCIRVVVCLCVCVFVCLYVCVFVCSWNRNLGTWDCVHVGLYSCHCVCEHCVLCSYVLGIVFVANASGISCKWALAMPNERSMISPARA